MDAIPWDYFAHNTDAERAAASRAQQRRWDEEARRDELRAEEIDRQRKEQLFKFFYGAAAEVSIREFPGFKPFATIETRAGATITVEATRITQKKPDQDSKVASLLLANAMWGGATIKGTKADQINYIAYGLALGVKVTGQDQDKFSEEDKRRVGEIAETLQASGIGPSDPRKQTPRSLQVWPHP